MTFRQLTSAGIRLVLEKLVSENYVPDVSGWAIERDGGAQFENLTVLGSLSAGDVGTDSATFGSIAVGGRDPIAELDALRTGSALIAWGYQTDAANTVSGTEVALIGVDAVIPPRRQFRLLGRCTGDPSVETDHWRLQIRATTDGTAPTITSAAWALNKMVGFGTYMCEELWNNDTDSPLILRCLLTIQRESGTGTWVQQVNSTYAKTAIAIYDEGPATPSTAWNSPGTSTPPPAPTPTPQPFTYTFYPTWDASYQGDGDKRSVSHLYQGYTNDSGGSVNGNNRSLIGFGGDVQSKLAGATITSCQLVFRVLHTYNNAGGKFYFGTHVYSSEPATWSGGSVNEQRVVSGTVKAGATVTIDLGTTIGTELRNGTSRGIAVGPAPTTSESTYGYLAGIAESGKPYLIVKGTK